MTDVAVHLETTPATLGSLKGLDADWPYLKLIFAILVTWFLASQALYHWVDGPSISAAAQAKIFVIKMVTQGFVFILLLYIMDVLRFSHKNPDTSLANHVSQMISHDPKILSRLSTRAFIAVAAFVLMHTNFMTLKTIIPDLMPFYLDTLAYKTDKLIFFGHDPWTLLTPILDNARTMKFIDFVYTAWAGVMAGAWFYALTSQTMDRARRYQYVLALILVWLIAGNILATLLSSAGPVYYAYFTGDIAAYAPLIERLNTLNAAHGLDAVEFHAVLLSMYENPSSRFSGISAIPSLHCATTILLLIFLWEHKIVRYLALAFTVIIFVGSVVLAWHYAIDGLLAVPIAMGCWILAGKIWTKFIPASTVE